MYNKVSFAKHLKNGFTLAEILITISILGVVAAVTIPASMNNFSRNVTVTKVRKAYMTLDKLMADLRFSTDCPDITCAVNQMLNGRRGFSYTHAETWDNNNYSGDHALHYYYITNTSVPDSDRENFNLIISEYVNFNTSKIIKTNDIFNNRFHNNQTYKLNCYDENNSDCTDRTPSSPKYVIKTPDGISYNFYVEKADIGERKLSQVIVVQVITDNINSRTKLKNGRNTFYFLLYGNFQVGVPAYSNWGQMIMQNADHVATLPADENNDFYCTTDTYYARGGFSCAQRILRDGKLNY